MKTIILSAIALLLAPHVAAHDADAMRPAWMGETEQRLETELVAEHGEAIRPRLRRGLEQVAALWRPEDGDAATFESFVRANFAHDEATRDMMFDRLESYFEQIGGLYLELVRELRHECRRRPRADPSDRPDSRWRRPARSVPSSRGWR